MQHTFKTVFSKVDFHFNRYPFKPYLSRISQAVEDQNVKRGTEEQILRTTLADRNKAGREKIQGDRL